MKLSQILSQLLVEYAERPLPLSILLERSGTNGFGTIAGILTIPMLIPLPIPLAGFSTLVGSGIILVGCQLVLGYSKPYLPKRIARIELSPTASQKLLKNINRLLQPLERMSKNRFSRFSNSWWGYRIIGMCLAWDALLMSLPLPIPLTNLVPAYTLLFLAIGLLESDGLFILIGYGMTMVTTIFFASIAGTIWQLAIQAFSYIWP
ncbi:exopolysaccharide biosynthesis protein [Chamaesiphon minutus]|uniref:Putative ABC-type transport system, permease component n=1 Tax=Chamaesiphon minutus (strain ATCC 27169 / PCC 6605) TaxID=1173020 RepID=K9UHN0_CHAP6|nr:exopolysaccharide biosynthesis protein [Chamaesiphon minutus]AFY93956.1 putative ABC-type transport system, permease component [Chamaesiphon minutus PCC 6605]